MHLHEIQHRPATTDAYPFVADVIIDPTAFDEFERAMEEREDVRLLCRIDQPNSHLVHVACTNEMTRNRLQDTWGRPTLARKIRG